MFVHGANATRRDRYRGISGWADLLFLNRG